MRYEHNHQSFMTLLLAGLLMAGLCGFTSSAQGATITGSASVVSVNDPAFDLTARGNIDWAYWDTTSSSVTGDPTNEKAGASVVGSLSAINGTGLRGSTADTKADFTFTDGTSPVSSTVNNVSGVFNQTLNTEDVGLSLDLTLPTAKTYTVYLWLSIYDGTGTLTATLPTASLTDDSALSAGQSSEKFTFLYTLEVTADNPGEVLDLDLVLSVNGTEGSLSHVLIDGVAVSIPTPAALPAGLAMMGLMALRRRQPMRMHTGK
ncbi:hypothetical protein HED60_05265 [Planctomycetales bacterium ZRK34]|nr:hypothetical protein HED60_05265 [Planctomycetales bacterium ZRK34]